MKKSLQLMPLVFILCLPAVSQAKTFVGTWQAGVNITVTIVEDGKTLSGKMVFLNPDHTRTETNISNPSVDAKTFSFQTTLGGGNEPFDWSLVLKGEGRSAILKGYGHEMLVEHNALKK